MVASQSLSESIHNFLRFPVLRQTDRRGENITSISPTIDGGGNERWRKQFPVITSTNGDPQNSGDSISPKEMEINCWKNKICIGRESNPGLPRGRREFYHWTTNAIYNMPVVRVIVTCLQCLVKSNTQGAQHIFNMLCCISFYPHLSMVKDTFKKL